MKIAVCLYGHLRTYQYCYRYLKGNICDFYDCDVFMHTWDTIESTTSTWHNDRIKKNINISDKEKELKEKYNLKDLIIEKQKDESEKYGNLFVNFSGFNEVKKQSIWGFRCAFSSMKKSGLLAKEYSKKHNIKYDYILFIRPDILLYNKFDIMKFIENLSEQEVKKSFFFSSLVHPGTRTNDIRCMHANDLIFFAAPNVMFKVIDNIDTFLNGFHDGQHVKGRAVESYILDLVQDFGFTNYRIDYNMWTNYEILREKQAKKVFRPNGKPNIFYKHRKKLKECIHSVIKFPSELISTLYYYIRRK